MESNAVRPAILGRHFASTFRSQQGDEEECPARTEIPSLGLPLTQLAVITWADASNHNRPDRASTIGTLTGIGPAGLLRGEEHDIALLQWKSGKTPRQCLGTKWSLSPKHHHWRGPELQDSWTGF